MARADLHHRGHSTAPQGDMTLWQMLVWTYQRQRAHQYLRTEFDWFRFAFDSCEAAGEDTPRPTVHPDAAAIHAAVTSLGFEAATCIVHYVLMGEPPEPFDMFPEPGPIQADRLVDRYGRGMYRGRLVDYRLEIVDQWMEQVPLYMRSRKSTKLMGYTSKMVEVGFCPIEWSPDPAWILAVNGTYSAWRSYMAQLSSALSDVTFRSHNVVDLQLAA